MSFAAPFASIPLCSFDDWLESAGGEDLRPDLSATVYHVQSGWW